ncbi:MAG: alpha/beta hydrolase [Desulfomonilaceae bacterium]
MNSGILRHIVSLYAAIALTGMVALCAGCSDSGNPTNSHKAKSTSLQQKQAPPAGPIRAVERINSVSVPSERVVINSKYIPDAVVVVTLPLDYKSRPKKSYPLVIAFGGAGECARTPREGSMAWVGYYSMDQAIHALNSSHLESKDFKGLVTPARLAAFNESLKKRPYTGAIVACPYSPLITGLTEFEHSAYEKFIIHELVPILKKRYRVDPVRIGVDGVSMGGARAMYFGLKYPQIFSSIGSIQGAFGPFLEIYAGLAHKNRSRLNGHAIQLVTSDGDGMAPSVGKMAQLLKDEGIRFTYMNLTGPHDYIFNQGPGSIALLMFHGQQQSSSKHGPIK